MNALDAMEIMNYNSLRQLPDYVLIECANGIETRFEDSRIAKVIDRELSNRHPGQELAEYQTWQDQDASEAEHLFEPVI